MVTATAACIARVATIEAGPYTTGVVLLTDRRRPNVPLEAGGSDGEMDGE